MWFVYIVFGLATLVAIMFIAEKLRVGRMSLEEKEAYYESLAEQQKLHEKMQAKAIIAKEKSDHKHGSFSTNLAHGSRNPSLKCPHCDVRGRVHTKQAQRKAGISGGKATGAILTGGVSLLATGLSRKEKVTEAYCDSCKSKWLF